MRSKVIAVVVIGALLAGGGWWYSARSRQAAATDQVQYRQEQVRTGEIRSTIQGTGPVTSVNGVLVRSNQTGTVAAIRAQDGDRVSAGQVVVMIENDSLRASLKQAQIDLLNNQTNLDNLLNPQATAVRSQQLKLDGARLTLKQRQTDQANLQVAAPAGGVVASVRAAAGSSLASGALLFTIFDDQSPTFTVSVPQQTAAMLKVGQTAQVEVPGFGALVGTVQQNAAAATPTAGNRDAHVPVDLALPPTPGIRAGMVGQATFTIRGLSYLVIVNGAVQNDAIEVRTQVAGTLESLAVREGDRVKAGQPMAKMANEQLAVQLEQAVNDVAVQEQNLIHLLDPSQDPNSQLRTLRSKVEQSQISLASRQSDVAELDVKAPVNGQVSGLALKVGDRVTTNQQLFRVADYGAMQITISVDELDIAKARLGQTATILLDALPGRTYTGKVSKINPEGIFRNDIATFEVTVQVEKPEGLLAGMNATVNITVEEKRGLYLPAQAVQVQRGRALVQQLENGEPVTREIAIGLRTSQRVEVVSGLNEGDQVITAIIRPPATGFSLFGGQQRQQTQTTFPVEQTNQQRQGQQNRPGTTNQGGGVQR